MSFSNLVRRRAHSVTVFCRHGSSTATNHKPQRVLPDEKLRALVSLYHQTDTFITQENLSERIDKAFLDSAPSLTGFRHQTNKWKDLKAKLVEQRAQARVTEWDRETAKDYEVGQMISHRWVWVSKGRERKVKQALHGLSDEGNLPGLEVLRDAVANGQTIPESDVRDLLEENEP